MYAVFELAGFQYSAQEGDTLRVPYQKAEKGSSLDIDRVLLIKSGDEATIGTPTVGDAKIEAEVVGDGLADKVLVYKYKRRTKYRRTQGHRQRYTEIKINKIVSPSA